MENTDDLLVASCRTMIRTVLSCLDNATKGTIYKIGLMPELTALRVLSGVKKQSPDELEWVLPTVSEYNPPGKKWEHYRDQPGRPLEAMGWCVEKQLSWTADNPMQDSRSVRKQLSGEPEDEYHMEPVLVRKKSLYGYSSEKLQYPVDWQGNPIWQDSENVVSAVIKIHFKAGTLRPGGRSTRIVRDLARSLGSELLTLWFRERLYKASKDFARQRLQTSEILAHELRNTLVKLGFVFSAINAQIGILRERWENLLKENVPGLEWKGPILEALCRALSERIPELAPSGDLFVVGQRLLAEQKELAALYLSPHQEREWVRNKIRLKWEKLLSETGIWNPSEIRSLLDRLSISLSTGVNFDFSQKIDSLPAELLGRWSELAYVQITSGNLFQLDEVIQLVEHPGLPVSHKEQMLRVLKSLRAIVHTIPEVEEKAARILQALRFGTWAEDQYRFGDDILDLEPPGEFEMVLAD
ncbi:MAG TPA: hypothetical protein VEF34_21310 [Syntrophobacteraceae bacterium]|nr:hypothetical protein [Syntrophobacteraceae bacterium]